MAHALMNPKTSTPLFSREEGREEAPTGLELTAQATPCSCFKSNHLVSLTFISAKLDVGKQANLNDLPKKPKDQVGFPFSQVLCTNIDNMTPDGGCRIQCQVQVLLRTAQVSETQPGEMLLCLSSSPSEVEISPLSLLPQQQLGGNAPSHSPAEVLTELWWQQAESIRTELSTRV